MGFLDFLQSVASGQTPSNPLAQRVAQQAVDAQHPTLMGRDVSGIPVLSGVIRPAVEALNTAGLIGEGAQRVAEATTGAGLAGLGAANRAGLLGMTRANQGELAQILGAGQGAPNPLAAAMAINQRAQSTVPGMGLVTAAVNPLNLTGPAGEAGRGLGASRTLLDALGSVGETYAPNLAQRGLGAALEGASAVGRAGMLPYEGAFGALGGGLRGIKGAAGPAIAGAAPGVAAAYDSAAGVVGGAARGGIAKLAAALQPAAPAAPAAPTLGKATLNLLATKGIDPAKLAGLDADLARYVAENAGPGQEDALIAALRGEAPAAAAPAATTPAAAPAASGATAAQLNQLRQAATFSDDPAVARAARARLDALETAPAPAPPAALTAAETPTPIAAPEIAPSTAGTPPVDVGDRTIPPALASALNPQDYATMPPAAPGQGKIAAGRARTMFEQLMRDLGPTDSAAGFRRKLDVALTYLADRGYNPMSEAEGNRIPFVHGPVLSSQEAARLLAGDSGTNLVGDGATQALGALPGRNAVSRTLTDIPALPEITPPAGPDWTHYGPETIYPGEGVTPELLDRFAKLRQFPNPSPLDVNAAIGAMRDPVTLLQQTYGDQWQNRLAALTGGKWGQPGSGATLVNGRVMLGDLDLTTALRDYLENRGGPQAADFKGALKGLLPEQGLPTPAAAPPSLSAPPVAPAGTLDDLRNLIRDHAQQFNTQYPPNDPAFYAKRANVDPAQVPAMLDQLVQEGTLGRLPDGSLAVKPGATPATGGDIAAGGGGFGLLPPRLGTTLAGAGVGTGVGGLAGGGLGLATGHRGDQLKQDIAAGAGLGALAGGSVGSVAPDLPPGLAPGLLPGLRTNLLDPLAAVGKEGAAALRQASATGEKNPIPSFSKALPYIRSIKKTSAMTLPRNLAGALTTTAIGEGNVPEAAANMRDIWRNLPTLLPALRAAGDDAAARDQALLGALPPRMQAYDAAGMRDLIEQAGVNYERNPTDLGASNVHPLAGAIRGAALGLATPKTLVFGPATLALGAYEGATLPARAAMQTAMLTPIDQGARMAFAFPEYARALADAAPGFLQRVQASGQALAGLGADGSFGAQAIADPTLAAEWRATQQAAAQAGGALAKDRLGNFSKPGVATNFINNFFPGGSWNVEQTKVLAKAAARHPQLAIGLLYTIEQDYQRHLAGGDPRHAGTWRLSDRTPGFGGLVRLANGGAAGDLYLNPAYPVSPVGADVLNLPRELSPQLNPGQSVYDKGRTIAGALGLGVNPEIDYAAYKAGQSATEPASQLRLAPVGAFADAMLHRQGAPLWANPLGQAMMPDAAQTPDLQQQIQFNRFLDPAAIRAGNEMIYEQRGTTSSDPKNADLVAQLRDPSSAFYHEALVRGLGGQAATAVAGNVVPGAPQAETATAHAGAAARMGLLNQGLPITREQFQAIAARPDAGVVLSQLRQAQIDAAKLANPVLAVQDVGTAKALGEKAFQQWERENGGLAGFPIVYNILAQREQERLGLVPLGTAMAQQQAYDQLQAGQAYGRPQPYPGVQPLPFDPQPMYDLYRLFSGGR